MREKKKRRKREGEKREGEKREGEKKRGRKKEREKRGGEKRGGEKREGGKRKGGKKEEENVDVITVWANVLVLVVLLYCEPPTASSLSGARVRCGCQPGPTRVMIHPCSAVSHQSASSCRAQSLVLRCRVRGREMCFS